MLTFIVLLSLAGAIYAYFGYPSILFLLNSFELGPRKHSPPVPPATAQPAARVSIIITVRNEAAVVREKLTATLALLYRGRSLEEHLRSNTDLVQVIIASDASDDGTDDAVREFAAAGVELVALAERGGKERAQKEAVAHATGEIIVFTDAKISLNAEAIDNFVNYFVDPTVGAVSSIDRVIADQGASSGEGFYVRYEMWLRSEESQFNSLVGLSGSCFAVRRAVTANLRTDIPSDFGLLIEARKLGLRGVHAPNVIGSYKAVRTEQEEFARKVRTVLRGMTALFVMREVMNPFKYGIFAAQVFSHKLMRWLVPWLLAVSFLGSFVLSFFYKPFLWIFVAMGLFFGAASLAWRHPNLQRRIVFKLPLFFCVVNAGIALAWIKFFSGERSVAWNPSNKGS